MSPERCQHSREEFASHPADAGPAWRAAADAGIDMNLLRHSLRLTPWERLQENQRSLGLVLELERAGRRLHERSAGHP